jgi:hypothetical protein
MASSSEQEVTRSSVENMEARGADVPTQEGAS